MFFLFFFVKKEMKVSLAWGMFLSCFPAIDVKKLLKWFAMIKSSEVVFLSLSKVIWWDPVFKIFMLIRFFIPYHILFESFLLISKYILSSFLSKDDSELLFDFCKFLMKNCSMSGVSILANLHSFEKIYFSKK